MLESVELWVEAPVPSGGGNGVTLIKSSKKRLEFPLRGPSGTPTTCLFYSDLGRHEVNSHIGSGELVRERNRRLPPGPIKTTLRKAMTVKMRKNLESEEDGVVVGLHLRLSQAHIISKSAR